MPLIRIEHIKSTFGAKNALIIALFGGLLLTGLMVLAHVDENWVFDKNIHVVYQLSVNIIIIFVVLIYLFYIIKTVIHPSGQIVASIVGTLIITIVLSLISSMLRQTLYKDNLFFDGHDINLVRDILVAFVAGLITLLLYNITSRLQISIEKEQLQNENLMVRYEALENQLDPHFLFNSLNTLSGLIGTDDTRAQNYLRQLASTYRYTMQGKRIVTLEEELEFVKSYCLMMQIRFGKNLEFIRNIDRSLLQYNIIPISIQLLIENALKHNIVSDRYPLTIYLNTTSKPSFVVSNQIRPKQEVSTGTGVGLANLSKRYKLLSNQEIVITQIDNTFSVEIPLIEPTEATKLMEKLYPHNLNSDPHKVSRVLTE